MENEIKCSVVEKEFVGAQALKRIMSPFMEHGKQVRINGANQPDKF
jgi:hypothetical protein